MCYMIWEVSSGLHHQSHAQMSSVTTIMYAVEMETTMGIANLESPNKNHVTRSPVESQTQRVYHECMYLDELSDTNIIYSYLHTRPMHGA